MTLHNKILSAYLSIIFCLALIAVVSLMLNAKNRELELISERRYQSFVLADELRQSSDDLTKYARLYVVTGDEKYEHIYWYILAIRNGQEPRPIDYERVYWDLVTDLEDKPRADGSASAIEDRMKEAGFTEAEFELLNKGKENSDQLVEIEDIAMNMVKGLYQDSRGYFTIESAPDFEQAIDLMFNEEYMYHKSIIMEPIEEFQRVIDIRTKDEEEQVQRVTTRLTLLMEGLIIILVLFMIWLLLLRKKQYNLTIAHAHELYLAEQQALNESEKARRDYLTGLPNRVTMHDRINHAIKITERNGTRLCLIMMDMDMFKEVNDTYGHQVGDELLKVFALKMMGLMRESDTICRYGGDEFVILIEDNECKEDIELFMQRLYKAFDEELNVHENKIKIGFSAGISFYPDIASTEEELLETADNALYKAKGMRKGKYVYAERRV